MKNNYDKGVFNGAVGVITSISFEDQQLRVLLEDGAENEEIRYDFDELDKLAHAYAISIHRSQGSEYPCVVLPVTTSAWQMLQRNLLYTAVTRAKRLVVLVGSRSALAKAVRTVGGGDAILRWLSGSSGLQECGSNGVRGTPRYLDHRGPDVR